MKMELLAILACPKCKVELDLTIAEEKNGEIIEGHLTCKDCNEMYPILNTIPNMLPKELRETENR
ncbi:MAG: methytransferase partner Trm112 [SAR202 cluster bacterium]|jgi:uncharacterized protein YbaR (Trm112 family)|nr:methytransferase partner Trm112 [SAR202 cluster bacterium]